MCDRDGQAACLGQSYRGVRADSPSGLTPASGGHPTSAPGTYPAPGLGSRHAGEATRKSQRRPQEP